MTKSTLCQTLKKPARQGRKLAGKGAYIDVSNRGLQVHLTQQAKIPSNFPLFEGIFAFAGFVSGLNPLEWNHSRGFSHFIIYDIMILIIIHWNGGET